MQERTCVYSLCVGGWPARKTSQGPPKSTDIGASQLRAVFAPTGHVTMSGDAVFCFFLQMGCYWHAVGGGQGCCRTSHVAQDTPKQRLVEPRMSECRGSGPCEETRLRPVGGSSGRTCITGEGARWSRTWSEGWEAGPAQSLCGSDSPRCLTGASQTPVCQALGPTVRGRGTKGSWLVLSVHLNDT